MKDKKKIEIKKNREFWVALSLVLVLIAAVVIAVIALTSAQRNKQLSGETSGTAAESSNQEDGSRLSSFTETRYNQPEPSSETSALPSVNENCEEEAQMPFTVPGFAMLPDVKGFRFSNGLQVLCAGRFSGFYLEDGSDAPVTDVLAVVVKNNGDSLVESGRIELDCGNGRVASFRFSGLPGGAAVLVQESEKMLWSADMCFAEYRCTECVPPVSCVFDFDADFTVSADDNVFTVENIGEKACESDVILYFKNFEFNLFMGGITYSARISGGIPAGETRQCFPEHFWIDTSSLIYLKYEN